MQSCTGIKAYITFMAKEFPEGELVEYQAKAERKAWQRNIHPIFCRPALKVMMVCSLDLFLITYICPL